MAAKTFSGRLGSAAGDLFVGVPFDVKRAFGQARPPVKASVKGHYFQSTISVYGGKYYLPVRRQHREAAGVKLTNIVEVTIELDTKIRTVCPPAALAAAFAITGSGRTQWGKLSYSKQKEYADSILLAKKPETRTRRIQKILKALVATGSFVSQYELAQLNVGIIRGPTDSPIMAEFAANLERINALADRSPGFVWRLQTAAGDATGIRPFENENNLVNMSVWRDLESLGQYVYRSAHVEVMRRRREWFEPMREAYLVLWWVPQGHRPSVTEAIAKLEVLRQIGPSPEAFTFRQSFPPPNATPTRSPAIRGDECPATWS